MSYSNFSVSLGACWPFVQCVVQHDLSFLLRFKQYSLVKRWSSANKYQRMMADCVGCYDNSVMT